MWAANALYKIAPQSWIDSGRFGGDEYSGHIFSGPGSEVTAFSDEDYATSIWRLVGGQLAQVDTVANYGWMVNGDLFRGPAGPAAIYTNYDNTFLAQEIAGKWHYEIIGEDKLVVVGASDSSGAIHLAYKDNQTAYYGIGSIGAATSTNITNALLLDLALTSTGVPHLLVLTTDDTLKHAVLENGTWQVTTLANDIVERAFKLHIDDQDGLHAVWSDTSGLHHAVLYGTWQTETIDNTPAHVTEGANITINPAGSVHVCYSRFNINESTQRIRYATNASGTWQHEATASQDWVWQRACDIHVGNTGTVTIAGAARSFGYYHAMLLTKSAATWTAKRVSGEIFIREVHIYDDSGTMRIFNEARDNNSTFRWRMYEVVMP